jgi:DNA-binding response OmpR family regulator
MAMNPRALHLVVADDQPDTVSTLIAILADEGHTVVGACQAGEVLSAIHERRPDAAILDIGMPGLSGYALAREIRERFGDSTPLLIAISGRWFDETDRMLAELAGFHHFLQKPCDPKDVLELLEPLTRCAPPPVGAFAR